MRTFRTITMKYFQLFIFFHTIYTLNGRPLENSDQVLIPENIAQSQQFERYSQVPPYQQQYQYQFQTPQNQYITNQNLQQNNYVVFDPKISNCKNVFTIDIIESEHYNDYMSCLWTYYYGQTGSTSKTTSEATTTKKIDSQEREDITEINESEQTTEKKPIQQLNPSLLEQMRPRVEFTIHTTSRNYENRNQIEEDDYTTTEKSVFFNFLS